MGMSALRGLSIGTGAGFPGRESSEGPWSVNKDLCVSPEFSEARRNCMQWAEWGRGAGPWGAAGLVQPKPGRSSAFHCREHSGF